MEKPTPADGKVFVRIFIRTKSFLRVEIQLNKENSIKEKCLAHETCSGSGLDLSKIINKETKLLLLNIYQVKSGNLKKYGKLKNGLHWFCSYFTTENFIRAEVCVYMQGWYEVKMWNIPGIYGK